MIIELINALRYLDFEDAIALAAITVFIAIVLLYAAVIAGSI